MPARDNPLPELDLDLASSWTGMTVIRNGAFSNLGFLSAPQLKMLTFVESPLFARQLANCLDAACAISTLVLAPSIPPRIALAVCPNPRRAFFEIHNRLATSTDFYWTDFESRIHPSAKIHPRADVPARNVVIEADVVIEANVTVAERTSVGERCRLYAGCVVGAESFQTDRSSGRVLDMVHAGGVRLEPGVRVFSNAVIARGLFRQFTVVGTEARIGNLAYVSHNVQIGARASIGHGAVLNGSVTIGDRAVVGPGVTVAASLSIGLAASAGIGSTLIRDLPAGESVMGMPAVQSRKMFRAMKEIERGG
jgi:UDP-3-O-[3-hydroxymyristoyl] glucosamine N-acyltransferase